MKRIPLEIRIGDLLRSRNMKLVMAESCTGGLVGNLITNVPGSSDYYLGSVTAYAYEAKEALLGVKHETLLANGAVSRPTVLEMASGVRRSLAGGFPLDSIIGVSISGIAGPGGGSPDKPVGSVWIGWKRRGGYARAQLFQFDGDRDAIRRQTVAAALRGIDEHL